MPHLDPTGLAGRIIASSKDLDIGRKGLATDGEEHAGRIEFEKGIKGLSESFKDTLSTKDPKIIVLSEWVYLNQELEFCGPADTDAFASATQAIGDFNDALPCLDVLEDKVVYEKVNKTYPTSRPKYRVEGMPKDAFHVACLGHLTRLRNALRTFGMNPIERGLYRQRLINVTEVQKIYLEKQKAALGTSG